MDRGGNYKRRNRRPRDGAADKNSASPPPSPRVVLMRPNAAAVTAAGASQQTSTITIATRSQSPRLSLAVSTENVLAEVQQSCPSPVQIIQASNNVALEEKQPVPQVAPSVMKFIDGETWTLLEHPVADHVLPENISSSIKVVAAVGSQSSGKSSLLNALAGKDVFKTHSKTDDLLQAKTNGVDISMTKERMFLLDTQPLLSAALLDEFIKTGLPATNLSNEIADPETYIYVLGLQLLTFLLYVCDHVVVVCDYIDIHLQKMISTSLMIAGSSSQANLIFFLKNKVHADEIASLEQMLDATIGRGTHLINCDYDELFSAVMTTHSKPAKLSSDAQAKSEKSWLVSARNIWDNSIRKSSLYADYSRFMP